MTTRYKRLKQRLARSVYRLAQRLDPLPPLLLLGGAEDPWEAVEIVRCTLLNYGINLPIAVAPAPKLPPQVTTAAANVKPLKQAAKRGAKRQRGATLVELVVGFVSLAVACAFGAVAAVAVIYLWRHA